MGKDGMALASLVAAVMIAVAFFVEQPGTLAGNMGICLSSPNQWPLSPLWGWIMNTAFLVVTGIVLFFMNKEYQLVHGSDTVIIGMFLIMAASNPWVSGMLSTSAIMALANLICLSVLFGCYRKKSSAQELFLIATILSLGSMIQYAFIFMMPAYIIGALFLKCFNFKGFLAFLMGIAAPYWVAIGLGIVPLDWFTMPTFTNLFDGFENRSSLLVGVLNLAFTVLIGMVLALNNLVKLYAGNTQRRLYNDVVMVLGLVCSICMVIDFNNLVAYAATVYMVSAVQVANLFAMRNIRYAPRWLWAISLLYVVGFAAMMF